MNKKMNGILWGTTLVCLIITIILWFQTNKVNPEYEEIKVLVISANSKTVTSKKRGNIKIYEVKVNYNGSEYELKNVHSLVNYSQGRIVNAYLHDGNIYANIEGIKSTSPIAIVYFVFLFGTFIMFCISLSYTIKQKRITT